MKKIVIKILAFLILSSFTAETAVFVFNNSKAELAAMPEKEDSEKKSEEEKNEKEPEKDKINISFRQRMYSSILLLYCSHLNPVITSAYLALPEIPPDRA